MPGPAPKSLSIRQRRNRATTRALLPAESQPIKKPPRLPNNPTGDEWQKLTRNWWRDIWTSPMRSEFLRADLGGLFRLAILVDMFWKTGKLEVAREVRLMEKEFGLTPLSRRRLEWTVADTEEKKDRYEQKRSSQAFVINGDDPRDILK